MRLPVCLLALVVCFSLVGSAQSPTPGVLAVRRVVLYKNGVGFFEHVGRISGDQDVTVTFTSAQLDDALKSLTALDLGDGRIAGITYNSTAPLAQRLAGLPFKLGDKADHLEFFRGVRGARVEVRAGDRLHRGRLVSAEPMQPGYGSPLEMTTMLTTVGERGEVRTVRLERGATVRLLDDDVSSGVTRYLSLVADDLRRDERRVTVAARGTGTRDLYVSYVAEVPVWKSTYRLLMPSENRPTPILQGWAVVDNTVGEDWANVEMALMAGAPQSFVQRLSQPRYVPRAEMAPPVDATFVPRLHDAGIAGATGGLRGVVRDKSGAPLPGATVTLAASGTTVARVVTGERGDYSLAARPAVYTVTFELAGFTRVVAAVDLRAGERSSQDAVLEVGALTETIMVSGAAPLVDTSTSTFVASAPDSRTVEEEMALELPQATAQPVGELFEYRIAGPVTVRKNESALVPILRSEISVDRVSLWNDGLDSARPLRAVWLTNTTGVTLDGGTLSIVDGGAFGGEGAMEAVAPGARRLVSFARDLSLAVQATANADRRVLVGLRTADGFVVERRETCGRRTYVASNDDAAPRTLVIEHPVRSGWTLAAGLSPADSTSSVHRFRLVVPPRASSTLVVAETFPSEFRYEATSLTAAQVAAYAARDGLGDAAVTSLRHLVDLQQAVNRAERAKAGIVEEAQGIAADQERVRENMGVLKGTGDERRLLKQYVSRLTAHEDRLVELAKAMDAATEQETEARAAFDRAARAFAVELGSPAAACR